MLTAVLVRHKPQDTKKYIREQLAPYADSGHFAFTKNPAKTMVADSKPSGGQAFIHNIPDLSKTTEFIIPGKRSIRRFRSKKPKKKPEEEEHDVIEEENAEIEQPDTIEDLYVSNDKLV